MANHALVLGGSGIQGWAVVNQLLRGYPSPESFSKITALTNRPLTDAVLWPEPPEGKLQVISGINLLDSDLKSKLQAQVPSIETVTHIFFFAYIFKSDPQEESSINTDLLRQTVTALETLSKNLKFLVISTGTKAYGVQMLSDFPFKNQTPLKETLPRIPEPYASLNFYYHQIDFLKEHSKGKSWTWCELRPDVIVGFVPTNNFYNLGQHLAVFLACYREIEGEGAECPFPGSEAGWKNLSNDSGQDSIAKFAVHAALHPGICGGGQAFNTASRAKPGNWEERWPIVCEFFGLKGTGPRGKGEVKMPHEYLAEHAEEWKGIEEKYGLVRGRAGEVRGPEGAAHFIMVLLSFDRDLDLGRMHEAWKQGGEVEELGSKEVWWTAFQRYRDAKVIP